MKKGDIIQMLIPQGSWYVGRVGEVIDLCSDGNIHVRWERRKGESKVRKKEWFNEFFLIKVT